MKKLSLGQGFTLIELLVVLVIIGILVGFVTINLLGLRGRARDGERKADLRAIQSALQLVRADRGCYPMADCVGANSFSGCGNPLSYSGSTYMQNIPCDPLSGNSYEYNAPNKNTYTITACLENANDSDRDSANSCTGGRVSYTVTNP